MSRLVLFISTIIFVLLISFGASAQMRKGAYMERNMYAEKMIQMQEADYNEQPTSGLSESANRHTLLRSSGYSKSLFLIPEYREDNDYSENIDSGKDFHNNVYYKYLYLQCGDESSGRK